MDNLLKSIEICLLSILLYYDHKYKRLPNLILLLLFTVVICIVVFYDIRISFVQWSVLSILVMIIYAMKAIGAGDGKLFLIIFMQFKMLDDFYILGASTLLGIIIGFIYKLKKSKDLVGCIFFYNRTQFPFMYACFPVLVSIICMKG